MAGPSAGVLRVESFVLSGYGGVPTIGNATIQEFTRRERWRRALTVLGKWWGAGVLAVLIPVAHLVLVPGCLLYGACEFWAKIGTQELVTDARGKCPDCGDDQALDLAPRWYAPQPVTCRACRRGLVLARLRDGLA